MAWNWYDYVLTGLSGGLYGAGKALSDVYTEENAKADKEKTDKLSDTRNKAKQAYLDAGYDEAAAEEAASKYMDSLSEGEKSTISFIDPKNPAYDALKSGNTESFAEKTDANNYFSLKNLQNASNEQANARMNAAAEEQVARTNANQAARNAGATRAAASAMSSMEGNQAGAQSAMRNASTTTQADWLAKQGYANALDLQSQNLKKGQFLNTMGAIFGGAGNGASTGLALGGNK